MLILTRKEGESVHLLGTGVVVTVASIRADGRIRLGFDAPDETKILRSELLTDEQRSAAACVAADREG